MTALTFDPWPVPLPIMAIVLLAWTVQVTTGFGATVLVLTLGAHWWTVEQILPVVVVLNLPATAWTTFRHRDEVDRTLLTRTFLPWMSIGGGVGLAVAPWVSGDGFRRAFGAFMAVQAILGLVRQARGDPSPPDSGKSDVERSWTFRGWVITSGLVQALFGAGGPPLVQATTRLSLHRGTLRSTLSAVWLASNLILMVSFIARHRIDGLALSRALGLAPCVPFGIALGERLHPWLPEPAFRSLLQLVLLFGGLALVR